MNFKGMVVTEVADGQYIREVREIDLDFLPKNEVLIKVHYSSLNYKDALSARGHKGISRFYPHIPGIDAAGIVEESNSANFRQGDEVVVTGYDLGMNTKGGYAQYVSVPADWIVKLPQNLSLRESMMYGTAGFTAAICVNEITNSGINQNDGDILITGATGGVGIIAVGILSKLGYNVVASTGKLSLSEKLIEAGANKVIDRNELIDESNRLLLSAKYAAVVDNVGGKTLSSVFRMVKMHGLVCVLGNVSGDTFETNVYPFLLRGVRMIGIDSASKDMELRKHLWSRISKDWKFDNLINYTKEVDLENLNDEIDLILKGQQFGRVIVSLLK